MDATFAALRTRRNAANASVESVHHRGSRDSREAVEWQGETKVNIACDRPHDRPVRSFETNDDTIIRLPFHFPSYNTSWIGHRLGRRRGTSLHTSSHFFHTSDDEGNIADTGCSHLGDDFCRGPSSRGQRPLQVPRPSKVSLRGKVSEHLHAIARRPFDSDQSIPLRADGCRKDPSRPPASSDSMGEACAGSRLTWPTKSSPAAATTPTPSAEG